MALVFDNFIFYHIPKTGGTTLRKVISEMTKKIKEQGHTHNTPLEVDDHGKYTSFTIVRHPINWYKSFYRYRVTSGWREGHFIDKHAIPSRSFDEFVKKMITAYPCGYVTSRYLSVTPFVDYVLRTEKLDIQFEKLMNNFGYNVPKNVERRNVTSRKIDTSLSQNTRALLVRAESRIIKHLGY